MNKDKRERLLHSLGEVDEKYVKEAESRMNTKSIIKVAAAFVAVIALSLYLFIPYGNPRSDLSDYRDSSYFPLIEGIDEYRLSLLKPAYKNNFESLVAGVGDLLDFGLKGGMGGDMAPMEPGDFNENLGSAPDNEAMGNGNYVESTDNQVTGVIESDLFKMTDKYIFRLGWRSDAKKRTQLLRVYSIEKENSALVSEFEIPLFDDEFYRTHSDGEMFLSLDGNTVTILKNYTDNETDMGKVGITSIDVSDVQNIRLRGMVSIDGSLNTSRMVDGRLLLVTEYFFSDKTVDYDDPTTFVPSIDRGNGDEPVKFENIIYPDEIGNTRYSVVALLDGDDLEILGANALLNFTSEVYVSANNLFITREYTEKIEGNDGEITISDMTDIAVIDYSGEGLEGKGIINARGWAEDQYSFDEKDGYLRVVTSTLEQRTVENQSVGFDRKQNASLYIFNLADNSLAYKLEDFALPGEEATAVRFDGDMLYVCTAVVVSFTDPVYFIDLSDYENIGSADTGVIEGYSDHLINLGEGFLLGIGRENWQYSKVEIYEQQGSAVVSVDEFRFDGNYSLDYKAYLVNREHNLFGFGVDGFYVFNEQDNSYLHYGSAYVLMHFNGYELEATVIDISGFTNSPDTVRAAYIDGYLYITTPIDIRVEKIK